MKSLLLFCLFFRNVEYNIELFGIYFLISNKKKTRLWKFSNEVFRSKIAYVIVEANKSPVGQELINITSIFLEDLHKVNSVFDDGRIEKIAEKFVLKNNFTKNNVKLVKVYSELRNKINSSRLQTKIHLKSKLHSCSRIDHRWK